MAASGAGLATAPSGDAQAPADGQAGEAQQAPDLGAISGQLNDLGQLLESQREYLQSEPWKPAEETPEEPALDFGFLDETQPGFSPEQAATQLAQMIETAAESKATAAVTPLQQQMKAMQTQVETDQLIGRYPELGTDDKVAQQVIDASKAFAEEIGHPELASDPKVWERMYLASRAERQANTENSGSQTTATLEGAGGASPGGAGQGDALTTQSVTAGWGGARLPLFGGTAR